MTSLAFDSCHAHAEAFWLMSFPAEMSFTRSARL